MTSAPAVRLGSQQPRLSSVPPAQAAGGAEAVEYAESVGLTLDPWQRLVLEGALGEVAGGMWAAFEVALVVSRQNGKGTVLEARELAGIEVLGERLVIHTAHELKTAEEAFLRMCQICEASPDLDRAVKRVVRTNGKESIEFKNRARIKYAARSKGSGRGFSGDLIVFDEAMFLGAEAIAALLPTLSTSPNPQVWYTASAGMAESTQLRSLRERALLGGDPSLAYFEWSAEEDAQLDDVEAWAQSNPALGIRISEDFIRKERAAMESDDDFARERLGIWDNPRGKSVIDLHLWQSLAERSEITTPVAFAADMTPDRSAASIAMCCRRPDERLYAELTDNAPGSAWLVARLVELRDKYNPPAIALDPAGPIGSLLPDMKAAGLVEKDEHGNGDLLLVSGREMAQSCGAFYDDVVHNDRLRHFGQKELTVALGSAKKRPLGDAWAWARKDATDISPLVAVTLARHALMTAPQDEHVEPNIW